MNNTVSICLHTLTTINFLIKRKIEHNQLILHREGLLDIRFGQEDNTNNKDHPCPGLFETCCNLRSERPNIPPSPVHTGCGVRNVDGVGFRITGDKDNEAQFGKISMGIRI